MNMKPVFPSAEGSEPKASTPLEIAKSYIDRGWNPLPVAFKSKKIFEGDWPALEIDHVNAGGYFTSAQQNIGVRLGNMSEGLTDVDLDCPEAEVLAPRILPYTGAVFGRRSKPRSHYLYSTDLADIKPVACIVTKDPVTDEVLIELRIGGGDKGAQTVFPGSVHESGERIVWAAGGDPEPEDGALLIECFGRLSAAVICARHWPAPGARNDCRLALYGFLLRNGWAEEKAAEFAEHITAAAGGDGDPSGQRLSEAANTQSRFDKGEQIYGFTKLCECLGSKVVKEVSRLLGFERSDLFVAKPLQTAANENSEDIAPTQDAYAEEFARRNEGFLKFDHSLKQWYRWNGDRWARDGLNQTYNDCRMLCRELGGIDSKRTATKLMVDAVEKLCQSDPRLSCSHDIWDTQPNLLGVPGGVVDLRTGKLFAPDASLFITKQTAAAPEAAMPIPIFEKFLDDVTSGGDDFKTYLQSMVGYILTGETREHALFFMYGPGRNGKSVFLNTISNLMADYAANAAMDTFTATSSNRHTTELARLRGARLVSAAETEEGRNWKEALVKQITGGDKITARFMRQDDFEFRPCLKLLVVGNHAPRLQNVDEAMRRRYHIIPFENQPSTPDPVLEDRLRAEWPGILSWAITGAVRWYAEGLNKAGSVDKATGEYFENQDQLSKWIEECCVIKPDQYDTPTQLFMSWEGFCQATGEKPGTRQALMAKLKAKGFESKRTNKERRVLGIYAATVTR